MNVFRKRVGAPKKKGGYKKRKTRYTYAAPVRKSFPPISFRPAGGNFTTATFIYTERGQLNAGALGAAAYYQFRLNSLFDPNLTGAGTQPVGHDQYAALYEKYRVYEVQYKVTFANSSTTADVLVAAQTCDDATTTTDWDRAIQNGQCEWDFLNFRGGSRDVVTFTGTVDLAKAQGMTRAHFWADDLQEAVFGNNPAEVYVLNLLAADPSSGDPPVVGFFVEIRYKAKLYGHVNTVAS